MAVLSPAKIRDGIDRLVNWMKWPTAVLSVIALPAVGLASVKLATEIVAQPVPLFSFLGGAVAYALLWWWFIRHSRITFLQTLEHELTHALFALTTLHRVTRLRAAWFRGGHIEFVGSGNWLITAAPYFWHSAALLRKASSPSFKLIELTMALPCTHLRPASMISHLELSIIMGTRAISGSETIRFKNLTIASLPSIKPSSIFTSMIWAPPST